MKHLIASLALALALLPTAAQAQEALGVWQDASLIYGRLFTDIDSVTFTAAPQQLQVWKSNAVVYTRAVAEIDSVTYYQRIYQDVGVIINGVKWATRNVDNPGRFTSTPESAGRFIQWNTSWSWPTTPASGPMSGWITAVPDGTEWEAGKDPSPSGWRMPNEADMKSLLDASKVTSEWTLLNGMGGYKFTDITSGNSLFLPAVGYRIDSDGTLNDAGSIGRYWSSVQNDPSSAHCLDFSNTSPPAWNASSRVNGFAVRSVAK